MRARATPGILVLALLHTACSSDDVPAGELPDPPSNGVDCWADATRASDLTSQGYVLWEKYAADPAHVVDGAVIIQDQRVLVSESAGRVDVRGIEVRRGGELVFGAHDQEVRTSYVMVADGGVLRAGSETCGFQQRLTFSIYGSPGDPMVMGSSDGSAHGFGNKVVGVDKGGTLELHGARSALAWTRLGAEIAPADLSHVVLNEAVDWAIGDTILVTTSDFEPEHTEERVITGVETTSGGGTKLTVDAPFTYQHWGGPDGVRPDNRASVALMTRNIVLQSELAKPGETFATKAHGARGLQNYGAHAMFQRGATIHLEGVRFDRMGQPGEFESIGRYPVHFHVMVDATGSYARRCVVRDSFTRWFTLHGTSGVELKDNVGYLSYGHGYYLEDGTETKNTLDHNLGALVRPSILENGTKYWNPEDHVPLTDADQCTPSVFWMANAYNRVKNNVAAGCTLAGRGFWFAAAIGELRRGTSVDVPELQAMEFSNGRYAPILEFSNNTAHSCYRGFDNATPRRSDCVVGSLGSRITFQEPISEGEAATAAGYDNYNPIVPSRLLDPDPTAKGGQPVLTILSRLTAFRNREWGGWFRPKWTLVRDSDFADNMLAGLSVVSGGDESGIDPGYWGAVSDSTFVGFSDNRYQDRGAEYRMNVSGDTFNKDTLTFYISDFKHERRGYQIYDGPTILRNLSFRAFGRYEDLFQGDAEGDGFGGYKLNHAAFGWFGPGNQFQYSALTQSSGLRFDERTTVRHWVYPIKKNALGQDENGLNDGDKQTFVLDVDGSLQDMAGSASINDFPVHRGPVWETECHSQQSCIASPYRYGNVNVIFPFASHLPNENLCVAKEYGQMASPDAFCIHGFGTGQSPEKPLAGYFQMGMLSQVAALHTAQRRDATGKEIPLPADALVRVSAVNKDESVRYSFCYPEASTPSELQLIVLGGEVHNRHDLDALWKESHAPGLATVALDGTETTVAGVGTFRASLQSGNLVVTLRQTAPRSTECYPAGTCESDPGSVGRCRVKPDFQTAFPDVCGPDGTICNDACRNFGNVVNACPDGGCPTMRIAYSGDVNRPLSAACSSAASWPANDVVYGTPPVCGTVAPVGGTGGTGNGGAACKNVCGDGKVSGAFGPLADGTVGQCTPFACP